MIAPDRATARAARLRYVRPYPSWIQRRRFGRGFVYLNADGRRVRARAVLQRIRSLAIPPAWTEVRICPDPRAHLCAIGRDARGRRQYRYHPDWRTARDRRKWNRVAAFPRALRRIHRRVGRDLARPGLPRPKILALVVLLLERTLIRVGNEEYAKTNGSVGLTTMRSRHVEMMGPRIRFEFKGKGGARQCVEVTDPRAAALLRRCRNLPGVELFQYVDESGRRHAVRAEDVNTYLREAAGAPFTAKDFRTWAATTMTARALQRAPGFATKTHARRHVLRVVRGVAQRLGNTLAICRKSYVDPRVIDEFLGGAPRSRAA